MKFEWDNDKAMTNLRKHGIRFADVIGIFDDPNAIVMEDPDHAEDRYVAIGIDGFGRLLVVVYTYRGDKIRLISARKATRNEHKRYGV